MPDTSVVRSVDGLSSAANGRFELVGRSAAVTRVRRLLETAASLQSSVLLVAEPGIDAEAVARELHARSRPTGPFLLFSCTVGDSARLEDLLFGPAARGVSDLEAVAPDSWVMQARGGSLCLVDITELSSGTQARLARVLRDGEVEVGGQVVRPNVRFMASAPLAIDDELRNRRFRDDLYRRIACTRIDLPALRDRREDIPALAILVLQEICATRRIGLRQLADAAQALLAAISWPGNLAELRAVLEHAVDGTDDDLIRVEQLLPALPVDRVGPSFPPAGSLREARLRFERDYIVSVLQHHGWRMAAAARTLGMQRPNLYRKARQLGIAVARHRLTPST